MTGEISHAGSGSQESPPGDLEEGNGGDDLRWIPHGTLGPCCNRDPESSRHSVRSLAHRFGGV
jgi:hypothetical protein